MKKTKPLTDRRNTGSVATSPGTKRGLRGRRETTTKENATSAELDAPARARKQARR